LRRNYLILALDRFLLSGVRRQRTMVTYRHPGVLASLVLGGVYGALACGATVPLVDGPEGGGSPGGASSGSIAPTSGGGGGQYPGHGFIVHEWGTNTIVVGSDGSMQRGLHHEEEDLPAFVYDRLKQGESGLAVDVKMETPVTYFYSDRPRTVGVSVSFPKGVLTQWYPAVAQFAPGVFPAANASYADPVMDPNYPFSSQACIQQFADGVAIHDGLLDWGQVQVLGRDAAITPPDAPLDRYTWSYARDVASNPVQVSPPPDQGGAKQPESEQFLFYRGLGNLSFPVSIVASDGPGGYDGGLRIARMDKALPQMGAVFVLRVGATGASFKVHPEGVTPSTPIVEELTDADAQPLEAYADALAAAMTAELDKTGLFHDEAVAMVSTWRRQWFLTPGMRVLYLAPQAWTDAQIPLTVDPKPDQTTRVMVIRVEAITRAQEDTDTKFAAALEADYADGEAHFKALGRFAEPRLRRALQLLGGGPKSAYHLLYEIAGANTSVGAGE
jgi:hypothetical protein